MRWFMAGAAPPPSSLPKSLYDVTFGIVLLVLGGVFAITILNVTSLIHLRDLVTIGSIMVFWLGDAFVKRRMNQENASLFADLTLTSATFTLAQWVSYMNQQNSQNDNKIVIGGIFFFIAVGWAIN